MKKRWKCMQRLVKLVIRNKFSKIPISQALPYFHILATYLMAKIFFKFYSC